ncbi:MAG TPA: Na/Pi cotransporter family protein [Devosia sp.]|nr:Na/Pi cotransporter family protein [Devosia sp.]
MAYLFLLNVGAALALLLWAIHMVQTGINRGWRPEITAALRWASGPVRPAGIGLLFAIALQSATATGMLAAGFAAKGALGASAGLAIMLGADLGSALVVYFLSLNFQVLAPVLLIVGMGLFFKTDTRKLRQSGRALAGIGLIFVAFAMLGEATAPLRESSLLPAVVTYLGSDMATAFLAGAAITWLLHSSVAAIVLLVTLSTHGVVSIEAASSLLMGANVGGALIPFVLTRGGATISRQIMSGNLILRGGAALIALVVLSLGARHYLPGQTDAVRLVNLHLIFNAAVLLVGLPLVAPVTTLVTRLIRRPSAAEAGELALGLPPSCLDPSSVEEPSMALGNTHRELIRMAEIVARMFEPIMDIYRTGDAEKIRQARVMEAAVNRAQREIKLYLASISFSAAEQEKQGHDLAAIAVNLEYIGDAITKTLLRLAEVRSEQRLAFSPSGWRELAELHQSVVGSMRLAQNVLVTRDLAQARQLVQRKSQVRALVDDSMRQHMQRLKEGTAASVATSNIHLETIRALKTINSLVATIGYYVLAETGDVLDSRLKPAD